MKKILIFLLGLMILPAFAVKITPDMRLKWNSNVVVMAAESAGLMAGSRVHDEVETTYYNLMDYLLRLESFSVTEAVKACTTECNKSDFLKNGRGESGKKCPEICEDFGNVLVEINNSGIKFDGENLYHIPQYKVHTEDKKFYVMNKNDATYEKKCRDLDFVIFTGDVVFDSSTNKIVAIGCMDYGDGNEVNYQIVDPKYKYFIFEGRADSHEATGYLSYVDQEKRLKEYKQRYEECINVYRDTFVMDQVNKLLKNPIVNTYELENVINNSKKINAIRNKIYAVNLDDRYFDDAGIIYALREYCISYDSINNTIRKANDAISCMKSNFKSTNVFKTTQTKTLEEARNSIVSRFSNRCSNIAWKNMKCTGKCNTTGQDYVTCTLGNLSATFEFEDICEGKYKEKFINIFK